MYLTGMVDKRTLEKYEREAKEKNRETWYLSWCMDTNQEGKSDKVGPGLDIQKFCPVNNTPRKGHSIRLFLDSLYNSG